MGRFSVVGGLVLRWEPAGAHPPASYGPAVLLQGDARAVGHPVPGEPAAADQLAGVITHEMMTFGRHSAMRRSQGELRHLEDEAVPAGWLAAQEVRTFNRDASDLTWVFQ